MTRRRLAGKVAVITGGISGIGLAASELFASEGAFVVAADINDAAGAALEHGWGESLIYHHTDVTDESQIESAISRAVSEFGRLDIMVNNVGAQGDTAPLTDLTADGFDSSLALLTRSVVMGHKHAARQFIAQQSGGSIVSTTSAAGIQGGWGPAAYSIAKSAIVGVVQVAAAELAPHRIRSNAIAAGLITTAGLLEYLGAPADQLSEFRLYLNERIGRTQPLGRLGVPADVAEAALWLSSDASSWVTGAVIPVDGGSTTVYSNAFAAEAAKIGAEFRASATQLLAGRGA
jgi:NAD(P)-dependent dehydrogenase (short-subunit alcohol dehydrogenase family)